LFFQSVQYFLALASPPPPSPVLFRCNSESNFLLARIRQFFNGTRLDRILSSVVFRGTF
jgi:hypothetical protein